MLPDVLQLAPADAPVDPSAEQARQLLEHELADPAYNTAPGLLQRFWDWLTGSLGGGGPTPQLPAVALVVVLVVVIAVAAVVLLRGVRLESTRRPGGSGVFDVAALTAADHRDRARSALAAGLWDEAVVEAVRAMSAEASERGLLVLTPGLTVQEVEAALAQAFPDEEPAVEAATSSFDRIRYGEEPVDGDVARAALDVEERLRHAQAAPRGTESVRG